MFYGLSPRRAPAKHEGHVMKLKGAAVFGEKEQRGQFYRKINKVTVYGRYMKAGQEPVPFLGATRKGNMGTLEGITRFRELQRSSFERAGKLKEVMKWVDRRVHTESVWRKKMWRPLEKSM